MLTTLVDAINSYFTVIRPTNRQTGSDQVKTRDLLNQSQKL